MANVKRTSKTSWQLIKPYCLVATLYTGGEGETPDNPAGDTFIFDEVVRDTTTISQDDNDTTSIENEFAEYADRSRSTEYEEPRHPSSSSSASSSSPQMWPTCRRIYW